MSTSVQRTTTHHRLLSAGAAVAFATVGVAAAAAPAHAADVNTKVWVCKYVHTPGGDEVFKGGKNPIEVSGNAIAGRTTGQINVGDQFPDAQGRSVVVQVGGPDPGDGSCSPTPPPVPPTTPTTPATSTTTGTTPGTVAPHTGGEGASGLPLGLVGGGVLVVGAALLAAEAERRRRAAARP
jgi:hypothetical protein